MIWAMPPPVQDSAVASIQPRSCKTCPKCLARMMMSSMPYPDSVSCLMSAHCVGNAYAVRRRYVWMSYAYCSRLAPHPGGCMRRGSVIGRGRLGLALGIPRRRRSVTAAARGFDHEYVAGLHRGAGDMALFVDAAIGAYHVIPAA